jgi:hypothetical protein
MMSERMQDKRRIYEEAGDRQKRKRKNEKTNKKSPEKDWTFFEPK